MSRTDAIIRSHLKKAYRQPHENIAIVPESDRNVRTCYVLIAGLPPPYLTGEYLFKLTITEEFPHKPPSFMALTKNGVYSPDVSKICISIGEFHANQTNRPENGHRAARPLLSFVTEIVNGMLNPLSSGIGIERSSDSEKELFAFESYDRNLSTNNKQAMSIVNKYLQDNPDLPISKAVNISRCQRSFFDGDKDIVLGCFDSEFNTWLGQREQLVKEVSEKCVLDCGGELIRLSTNPYRKALVIIHELNFISQKTPGESFPDEKHADLMKKLSSELSNNLSCLSVEKSSAYDYEANGPQLLLKILHASNDCRFDELNKLLSSF